MLQKGGTFASAAACSRAGRRARRGSALNHKGPSSGVAAREAISSDVAPPAFSFAVGLLRSITDDFPRPQPRCGACEQACRADARGSGAWPPSTEEFRESPDVALIFEAAKLLQAAGAEFPGGIVRLAQKAGEQTQI